MNSTKRYLKVTELIPLLREYFEVKDEVSGHAVKLVRKRIEKYYEDYERIQGHTPPWVQRKHSNGRDYWQIDRRYWRSILTDDPEIKRYFVKRSSDPVIRSARAAAARAAKIRTDPIEAFEESPTYATEPDYVEQFLIDEDIAKNDIRLKIEALFDTLIDFDFAKYVSDYNEHEELLLSTDADDYTPTEESNIRQHKLQKLSDKLANKRNYAKPRINQEK